jgi:hypothetical protein
MDEKLKEIEERWKNVDGFSVTLTWCLSTETWCLSTETPILDLNRLIAYAPDDIHYVLSLLSEKKKEIEERDNAIKELEGQIDLERASVSGLSLANQDLMQRIKELEEGIAFLKAEDILCSSEQKCPICETFYTLIKK